MKWNEIFKFLNISPSSRASFKIESNSFKEFNVSTECSSPKYPACNIRIATSIGHHTSHPGNAISLSFHNNRIYSGGSSGELELFKSFFFAATSIFKFVA